VAVTYLPASGPTDVEPPRIAFAVPRKVGTAVVRNRLRRQVKAHLASVAGDRGRLASGAYLVALRPGASEIGRDQLLADVDRCVDRLSGVSR
jgi:ribonuclease P protein component